MVFNQNLWLRRKRGIEAGTLAVGSSVYLMESGSVAEYLVVNQGIPGSSRWYDSSCDGTWLLRKKTYAMLKWHWQDMNNYETSDIHTFLNNTFIGMFDSNMQSAIKQVKIPYRKNAGSSTVVTSGADGLSTKIFLLSATEAGFNHNYMPANEGAELDYFRGSKDEGAFAGRIAYSELGYVSRWYLRSPYASTDTGIFGVTLVGDQGDSYGVYASTSAGIRPALIIPATAYFDEDTRLFKGGA